MQMLDQQIQELVEKMRPPEEIRDQLDIHYSFDGNELILLEVRPRWNQPEQILKMPIARARYVKARGVWKLYWMRASGAWQLYEPAEYGTIVHVFKAIDHDKYGCFMG